MTFQIFPHEPNELIHKYQSANQHIMLAASLYMPPLALLIERVVALINGSIQI